MALSLCRRWHNSLGCQVLPVHKASLCEAQRLVQEGAPGIRSQLPHPPGGPEPTWPLTPNLSSRQVQPLP